MTTGPALLEVEVATAHRIAWSVDEAAALYGHRAFAVRRRLERKQCAYVRLSPNRLALLEGDVQALQRWPAPQPTPADDGRATVRRAFGSLGRDLRPDEIAAAVGVHVRTIDRALRCGYIRGGQLTPDGWRLSVAWFRRWLLDNRVAARWEVR